MVTKNWDIYTMCKEGIVYSILYRVLRDVKGIGAACMQVWFGEPKEPLQSFF